MPPLSREALAGAPLVLVTAALAYALYHHLGRAPSWRPRLARCGIADPGDLRAVCLQRVSGAVLLGLLPLLVLAPSLGVDAAALGLGPWRGSPWPALLAAAALTPIVALSARRPRHRARYPEVRLARWTLRTWALNGASWALYLLGYELLFRGLLLLGLAAQLDPWSAVGASTALYVLAHLDKDAGECLACAPAGVLFALLALSSGGIWAPFLVHLAVALTNDTAAGLASGSLRFTRDDGSAGGASAAGSRAVDRPAEVGAR